MMTASERNDPGNKQKAVDILEWAKKEEQKKEKGISEFIRGDFYTPGSSGESTGTLPRALFVRDFNLKSHIYVMCGRFDQTGPLACLSPFPVWCWIRSDFC